MSDARTLHEIAERLRQDAATLDAWGAASAPPQTPSEPPAETRPPIVPPAGKGLQNAPAFFSSLRGSNVVFGGRLTASQVAGCERLCAMGAGVLPLSWMAYVLASAYHEGGHTMQPIRERGSGDGPDADVWDDYLERYDTGRLAAILGNTPEADGDGILFAGKGDIMITGRRNYAFATKRLRELGFLRADEDLTATPDLALRGDVSAAIAVFGCKEGWFTGETLREYLLNPATLKQFTAARAIVNGSDRAALIAGYAVAFQEALTAGGWL